MGYVDVLLPVAVPNLYTYSLPVGMDTSAIKAGMRVCVQFGKRKLFTALVVNKHTNPPAEYETKEILAVLDSYPVTRPWQMGFWNWISEYYMCTPGEVFNAALPNGLRPEGLTRVFAPDMQGNRLPLSENEAMVLNIIDNDQGITIEKLAGVFKRRQVMPVLRDLLNKGLVQFEESLGYRYKPKQIEMISLHENLQLNDALNEMLNRLERRAPKQADTLLAYLSLSGFLATKIFNPVAKTDLLAAAGVSTAILKNLIDKNVFVSENIDTSRLDTGFCPSRGLSELNEHQASALKCIRHEFSETAVVLLHGVTSSGKTEIYIHLIQEQLNAGRQVLYLLPEIALTSQIISRLRAVFGDSVGVYHSKFSDSERVEVWNNLIGAKPHESPAYKIILGVRSSLFLPFENLGLIIVDEEHENTYKQHDPAPRYHARDAAIVLAGMHKAKVLLGTATPSLESYYNAKTGKYALVELKHRYLDINLPEVVVANTNEARRKRQMSSHFTPTLINEVQQAIANNGQVILFQNRRGFSPYLECAVCGWVPACRHCDVSLTYHKAINKLVCHYCGYNVVQEMQCKACGSTNMQTVGFGTEKIEDDIKILFPRARVARMDYDTTRRKKAYDEIIDSFAGGEVDILIGTQMVSKGLDFDNVHVVGILNADNMLNFPDFRAHERSFQLMAQVSGRAGRKKKQGKVVIQASNPENLILKQVVQNDYDGFFNAQLPERNQFKYPPFYRLISLSVRHTEKDTANRSAGWLAEELRKHFGDRVLGPQSPIIGRIQNKHIKDILIKLERSRNIAEEKKQVIWLCNRVKTMPGCSTLQIIIDVDPY
ncbi:MAG: primosomal protein N' [Bacteroidales bacterium]|nr:primosomal protein N' [Bacteroidales bacterium]